MIENLPMEQQPVQDILKEYATLSKNKILASQSDLNPKDRAMPEMLAWCRRQNSLVVLQNGTILCSDPASRVVQNCKIVMLNKGLMPGIVYPATQELVEMLLANAVEQQEKSPTEILSVSTQQQRLRMLVKEALDVDATDIHIEVRSDIANIRFRKHGELFLHAEWLPRLAREIATVAFNKETDHAISHFNPLVPQSASMPLQIDDRVIRLRLSSLPAHGGFDVVMRLLATADDKVLSLAGLGYGAEQITEIKKAVKLPYGAVIVAGPTGSGKTTTLASCMRLVDKKRKVYSIEDPVEKLIQSVTQVPVNTEHYDRSFASMARTVLRMDPDVIVLGEMRDEDTAHVMVRAAMTGHLVFSTVHSNTAIGIISRMLDLGMSSSVLASPNLLACLICQRLAPVLCEHCAKPFDEKITRDLRESWHNIISDLSTVRVRGENCVHCQGLGISGRTVVAEIIWVDEVGRQFIQQQNLVGWRKHLQAYGWQAYHDQLIKLVIAGRCDPRDAESLAGNFY